MAGERDFLTRRVSIRDLLWLEVLVPLQIQSLVDVNLNIDLAVRLPGGRLFLVPRIHVYILTIIKVALSDL